MESWLLITSAIKLGEYEVSILKKINQDFHEILFILGQLLGQFFLLSPLPNKEGVLGM